MKSAYTVTLEQRPAEVEIHETIIRNGMPIVLEGWDAIAYRLMRVAAKNERSHETHGD